MLGGLLVGSPARHLVSPEVNMERGGNVDVWLPRQHCCAVYRWDAPDGAGAP